MRILLVENDVMLGEALAKSLAHHAHAVDWVRDGLGVAAHWQSAAYDLVILDLGLPGRDGLQVLADARRAGHETPVIILTARDAIQDRVKGLDAGADDYLLKPFDLDELLARLRALGRRRAGHAQPGIEHLGLSLDLAERRGSYAGSEVSFTRREFALLTALLEQPGRVWTKEQLVERLYGWDEEIASNALEVHVHALRRKLTPEFIGNARGVGYFCTEGSWPLTSLRRRLVITLLSGMLLSGLMGVVGSYWQSIEELNELFDAHLRAIGDNLTAQSLASHNASTSTEEDEDDIVVQVWGRDGRLQFGSNSLQRAPVPNTDGLSTLASDDGPWRSYSRVTPEGGYLQVAQALSARQQMAAASSARLLLPLIVMLPLLAIFISWAVSRNLRPLRSLADQLERSAAHRQISVVVADEPRELKPVIAALNDLLQRQAAAAHKQQAFLADAAHELRTPLTVVGLQVQRAQQAATGDERLETLSALKAGVERATRLVTQLLALAHSESDQAEQLSFSKVNFESLLTGVLADLYPLAAHKGVDLGLVESQPCSLLSDGEGLRSLVINLVDNAIRHTPAGGRVDVSLRVADHKATLLISDTGSGIAPARRQAVFERFVREGEADSRGTGLGLAIVRQVVERHGGSIELEDGPTGQGLTVRVVLHTAQEGG